MSLCERPGCTRPIRAKGECSNHYEATRLGYCCRVPAEPLALLLDELHRFRCDRELAERADLSRRTVLRIRNRIVPTVQFNTADRIVTAFDGDPSLLEVA